MRGVIEENTFSIEFRRQEFDSFYTKKRTESLMMTESKLTRSEWHAAAIFVAGKTIMVPAGGVKL